MHDDENLGPDQQIEQRSLAATIAAAAVTGTTAGVANAGATQLINALRKPKNDSPPPPPKEG
jgi:hypothetical protein